MSESRPRTQVPDVTDPEVYKRLRQQVIADLAEDRRMQQTAALKELFSKLNPRSWFNRTRK